MPGQRLNASIIVQNLLKTPEEFAAIPLRMNQDGSIVRVRDVGRTELGTERYGAEVLYDGRPTYRSGRPAGRRGQRPENRGWRQSEDGGAIKVFPSRHEGYLPL